MIPHLGESFSPGECIYGLLASAYQGGKCGFHQLSIFFRPLFVGFSGVFFWAFVRASSSLEVFSATV